VSGAPWVYQAHTLASLGLFALRPFSRLVHAWTATVLYVVRRSQILYRLSPLAQPRLSKPAPGSLDAAEQL
jgi:nitrate reductase gamma subunit